MKNKLIISGAIAAGIVLAGAVGGASAHTGGVSGVAECQSDGTVTVTWTYEAYNVPAGVEAETKAMTTSHGQLQAIDGVDKGGQIFLSTWTEHQINNPGVPVKTGDWSAQFATVNVAPGSGVVTTMVQTDWLGGPSEDPVGSVEVPGTCDQPEVPVYVTPVAPILNTLECYAEGEKPSVTPGVTEGISYVVTEDPLNIFHTAATPVGDNTYLNAEAAIAAGFLPTESQTFVRTDDLSYAPACPPVTPPVVTDPPTVPSPPAVVPGTPVEAPVAAPVVANDIRELPATGVREDAKRIALIAGLTLVIAGSAFLVTALARRRGRGQA